MPCVQLEQATPDRKSIMASRSFGRPVETRQELEEAVASFAARAAEKMRRQNLATANLTVFIHTDRFQTNDKQYVAQQGVQLPVASADTGRLSAAARFAVSKIWREGYRYKKAGVMLLDLVRADQVQAGLFNAPDDARSRARMAALDAINARFGRNTICYAAAGTKRGWNFAMSL